MSNVLTNDEYRKTFADSDEHSHRQFMRRQVRKAKVGKNERDVVLALMNIWFVRKKTDGVMHPGRKKIAKMANCSIRTVASIMARMREAGALIVVSHGKGGRASTRYKMDFIKLILFLGYKLPIEVAGELKKIVVAVGNFTPFHLWKKRAKLAHGNNKNRKVASDWRSDPPDPQSISFQITGGCHV